MIKKSFIRWGVIYKSPLDPVPLGPLYNSWHPARRIQIRPDDEPIKPLFFTTRKACREFCKRENERLKESLIGRLIPVKVIETLEVVCSG